MNLVLIIKMIISGGDDDDDDDDDSTVGMTYRIRRFWGTSKRQRASPHVKFPPRSNPNQITYLSLVGAVIQMFDKTPATEKFPNLHMHGALNRTNTV